MPERYTAAPVDMPAGGPLWCNHGDLLAPFELLGAAAESRTLDAAAQHGGHVDSQALVRPDPSAAVGTIPAMEAEDPGLVQALRAGDERAFVALIERYHPGMVRLALTYVADRAVAEEVAQETWLAVLKGIDRFEPRASLKTWIFRILVNRAKTTGAREERSVPMSAFGRPDADTDAPAVDPDRFLTADAGTLPAGWWGSPPRWGETPERLLLAAETRACASAAIAALPERQRAVMTLRDLEGWTSQEVCTVLELTEANQRVLLHRARSRVRGALERYFAHDEGLP